MSETGIVMKCSGPCGEEDKQLYPVEVDDKVQLWCMECSTVLVEKEEENRRNLDLQERHQKLYSESGIPSRIAGVGIDDYVSMVKKLKAVKDGKDRVWSDTDIENIRAAKETGKKMIEALLNKDQVMGLFAGKSGTGKTLLEGIILNALLEESLRCRFYHAKQLLAKLTNIDNYQEMVAGMADNVLTVIDDLTHVPKTEFTVRAMSDIINTLYMEEKSLIISTNYSGDEIAEYIGASGHDRLQEGVFDGIMIFDWESFRGKKL